MSAEQEQKMVLESMGLYDRIYYMKLEGSVISTVLLCNKKSNEVVARGITICSPLDQFNKKQGRVMARGRAIKAAVRKDNCDAIQGSSGISNVDVVVGVAAVFGYKSAYKPELTEFEQKLCAPRQEKPNA